MGNLPLGLSLTQTQTQWSAQLNPLLSNTLFHGRLLTFALINGTVTISHGLSSMMQGFIQTDITGAATYYRSQPLNSQTLTLTSNAAVTVTLWVF